MAPRFAEGTSVPVERTRIEVEETVRRFGADSFVSGYEGRTAFIAFRAMGRMVRLTLAMPDPDEPAFFRTPTGRARDAGPAREAYEAECRRRWRALALVDCYGGNRIEGEVIGTPGPWTIRVDTGRAVYLAAVGLVVERLDAGAPEISETAYEVPKISRTAPTGQLSLF